jgi:hypothetical protein
MRILIGFGLFALLLGAGISLASFRFDGSMPGNRAVIAPVADPRWDWQSYPVGGLFLCRRMNPADSTQVTCVPIPEGSFLVVRFEVKPDSVQTQPRGPGDAMTE